MIKKIIAAVFVFPLYLVLSIYNAFFWVLNLKGNYLECQFGEQLFLPLTIVLLGGEKEGER